MKKVIIAVVAIVVIVGGGAAAYFFFVKSGDNSSSSASSGATAAAPLSSVTACDVLTEDVAKAILGTDISKPDGSIGDISTADIAVTNCNYTTNIHATSSSVPKASGVSVLARVAKTEAGATSNKEQFQSKPAGVEDVNGIGDNAFYNPAFRQLNVLKGNNWYIVTYYIDSITNANSDTDKQLAQKLQFQ